MHKIVAVWPRIDIKSLFNDLGIPMFYDAISQVQMVGMEDALLTLGDFITFCKNQSMLPDGFLEDTNNKFESVYQTMCRCAARPSEDISYFEDYLNAVFDFVDVISNVVIDVQRQIRISDDIRSELFGETLLAYVDNEKNLCILKRLSKFSETNLRLVYRQIFQIFDFNEGPMEMGYTSSASADYFFEDRVYEMSLILSGDMKPNDSDDNYYKISLPSWAFDDSSKSDYKIKSDSKKSPNYVEVSVHSMPNYDTEKLPAVSHSLRIVESAQYLLPFRQHFTVLEIAGVGSEMRFDVNDPLKGIGQVFSMVSTDKENFLIVFSVPSTRLMDLYMKNETFFSRMHAVVGGTLSSNSLDLPAFAISSDHKRDLEGIFNAPINAVLNEMFQGGFKPEEIGVY